MSARRFVLLWTLAVVATVAAFIVHLGLRGQIVDLGYRLGRARAEQAKLREINRVLDLEAASHRSPQRVEVVARTLLGMTPPSPERIIPIRRFVPRGEEGATDAQAPSPTASAAPRPPDGGKAGPTRTADVAPAGRPAPAVTAVHPAALGTGRGPLVLPPDDGASPGGRAP